MSADLRRLTGKNGGAHTESSLSEGLGAAGKGRSTKNGAGGGSLMVTSSRRLSSDSFIARVSVGPTVIAERVVNFDDNYGDNDPKSAKLKSAKKKQKKEKTSKEGVEAPSSLGNQNTSATSTTMSGKKWIKSSSHEKRSATGNDNGGNSSGNRSGWAKWAGPATVHAIEVVFAYRAGLYVTFFQLHRQGESNFELKYMKDRQY